MIQKIRLERSPTLCAQARPILLTHHHLQQYVLSPTPPPSHNPRQKDVEPVPSELAPLLGESTHAPASSDENVRACESELCD